VLVLFGPLGLQRQLIGDLERLAKRQYDLVGQILHTGRRKRKRRRRKKRTAPGILWCENEWAGTYHFHRAEHVAVVVAGLQVLGDVGERAQVLRVLGRTRDVTDLVLRDDVLRRGERQRETRSRRAVSSRADHQCSQVIRHYEKKNI